jgi:hypothetical protein
MTGAGTFVCAKCRAEHVNNLTAPRLFHRLSIFAGRRGGKSLVGALGAREEMCVPNTLGWVCGPTFKILEDATMPTLLRLIPPDWVKAWKEDNLTLTLTNGSQVAFRSLDDPERGRGQGPHWAWFDETTRMVERAWDVFRPSLSENAGIAMFTMSPAGYDWCYDRLWKPAKLQQKPGFWVIKYKTLDNPVFKDPELIKEIEEARTTMSPEFFAQEYEAEFVNFTGAIYGQQVDAQVVGDREAMKAFIPEWPNINPDRSVIVGLDSGADHPFGAVLIVVTEHGLIVVDEYLERGQAYSVHLEAIMRKFGTRRFQNVRWTANRNDAQVRLEFGLRGVGVMQAENDHQIGIQRVKSWLHTRQMYFAYTAPKTAEQMRAYRWADNYGSDGQKRVKEDVFKKFDELPDCIRYAVMAWPELPKTEKITMSDGERARWSAFDEKTRMEIERVREYNSRPTAEELQPLEDGYPLGEFFSPYTVPYLN